MRRDEEEDPKRPQPVAIHKKGTNQLETAEGRPWLTHKEDRDRRRHVV
jgi:hypothetical protein